MTTFPRKRELTPEADTTDWLAHRLAVGGRNGTRLGPFGNPVLDLSAATGLWPEYRGFPCC